MMNTKSILYIAFLLQLSACGGGNNTTSITSPASNSSAAQGNINIPMTNTISGTVVDKLGVPISGVTISVFHHNNNTTTQTTTNSNGIYSLAGQTTNVNADYVIYAEKTGFGFSASVNDVAGVVIKFDFNGLYRNVIRFVAMPAHNVGNINFTAFRAGDKAVNLARTGQTQSFANGDDAAIKKGATWPTNRFTDNANGTVTDHLTGLVWLKNATCFAASNWNTALGYANQLANGQCGLTDGSSQGQWRMPNINELESLVDISQSQPAVSAGAPFSRIALGAAYWSSTTYAALNSNAMSIRFTDGRWINGADNGDENFNNNKTNTNNFVWAVKSKTSGATQILATGAYAGTGGVSYGVADDANLQLGVALNSPRFIDNGDGTLADTVTGLIWLKKADCIQHTWDDALARINQLANGQCGLQDGSAAGQWRMPNRTEMLSLSDRAPTFSQAAYFNGQYQANNSVTGSVIFDHFINSDYYWTSSTNAAQTNQAWSIYSCDFGIYNQSKQRLGFALAVR